MQYVCICRNHNPCLSGLNLYADSMCVQVRRWSTGAGCDFYSKRCEITLVYKKQDQNSVSGISLAAAEIPCVNQIEREYVQLRYQEEIINCECDEALQQVARRSWGCPSPENVQGLMGWGFEQHGLVKGHSWWSWGSGTGRSVPTQTIQ